MPLERNVVSKEDIGLESLIRTNLEKVVDFDHILKMKFRRFKRTFHLGSRKVFHATIYYTMDDAFFTKELIVKQVHDSKKSYEEHKSLFHKFETMKMPQLLPKPLFFLLSNNYVAMDYIKGETLSNLVYSKLITRSAKSLDAIIERLGSYLSIFHGFTNKSIKPVQLSKVTKEIIEKLKKSDLFSSIEKTVIFKHLHRGIESLGHDYLITRARIFNDWTIRNFLIDEKNHIKLVDIDAMVHPDFPEYDIVWNDISSFLLNLESKTKYSPIITKNKIHELESKFLNGYNEKLDDKYSSEEMNCLHYIGVVRFYLGMIERNIEKIFWRWPGYRFINKLKKSLINGKGSIFGNLS